MSHHVMVGLPDGRAAIADYRQPVTHIMRLVNNWLERRGRQEDPGPKVTEAYAMLGRWLDAHPEEGCTPQQVRDGTCTHPEAEPVPFTPPPYREGTLF
jgi:hypothetical protein